MSGRVTLNSDRTGAALILALAICLLLAATRVSVGFYNIDELIYFIGANALARTGNFVVENGYDAFRSDDLRIWFLAVGPEGLTPQYPIGSSIAALPLMDLLGRRTLIFLNVVAGIGTLVLTHLVARRLFGSDKVAVVSVIVLALCSFWPELVLAHWPHSLSVLCTLLAFYSFLVAMDGERKILLPTVVSGLAVGMGMFFRLEAVLLLPAFTAIAILFAPRPVLLLTGGVSGFLPMLVLMVLSNEARFGTLSPLSYGSTGGATDLSRYIVLGVVMLVALSGLVSYRVHGGFGRGGYRLALVAGVFVLGALALSPYGSILTRLLRGAYGLLVDSTIISDKRGGVQPQADGTLLFWGMPKKALGQSLPWLGCLAVLVGGVPKRHGRGVFIVLTIFVVWSLPFVISSWHGGLGSNMRYFLPWLPALAILSAWIICRLYERAGQAVRGPVAAAVCGFGLAVLWAGIFPDRTAQLHQHVSLLVLAVVTLFCFVAGLVARRTAALLALLSISAALGFAAYLGLDDLRSAQSRRTAMANYSADTASIQGRFVIYIAPEAAAGVFDNSDQLVAMPHPVDNTIDVPFVNDACQSGYRVLVVEGLVPAFLKESFLVWKVDWPETAGELLFEVSCPSSDTRRITPG